MKKLMLSAVFAVLGIAVVQSAHAVYFEKVDLFNECPLLDTKTANLKNAIDYVNACLDKQIFQKTFAKFVTAAVAKDLDKRQVIGLYIGGISQCDPTPDNVAFSLERRNGYLAGFPAIVVDLSEGHLVCR